MMIKQAYNKVKSGYTYIEDVHRETVLTDRLFLVCITELAKQRVIELLPGTELLTERKSYQVNGDVFYGMQWIKDTPDKESTPTAFERLFERVAEITAVMESTKDKSQAVAIIKEEFPEFSEMTDNTVKSNITAFPFLCRKIQEMEQSKTSPQTEKDVKTGRSADSDALKQENTALQNELDKFRYDLDNTKKENELLKSESDNLRQELSKNEGIEQENELLKSELDNLRQKLSKNKSTSQDIERVIQENELLKSELDNLRQNLDKGNDMDMVKELQDLKNRVLAVEVSLDKSVSDSDTKVSKQDIPEYVDQWKVTVRDGYYKIYKTINSKLIWIHLGRNFDIQTAQKKIQEKLSKLDKNISNDTL